MKAGQSTKLAEDQGGEDERDRSRRGQLVAAGVALVVLGLVACGTVHLNCTDEVDPVSGRYTGRTFCGIRIQFPKSGPRPQAAALFGTREVDPYVYSEDPSGAHSFTVTATMPSGGVVTFAGALVRDPATQVAPIRSGYQVLVFRPSNPSALQAFIDQYWDVAVSYSAESLVSLVDLSTGGTRNTFIDLQAFGAQEVEYLGSISWVPPSYKERHHNLNP